MNKTTSSILTAASIENSCLPQHRRSDLKYFMNLSTVYSISWTYNPGYNQTTSGYLLEPKGKNFQKDYVVFLHGGGNDCFFPHRYLFGTLLEKGFRVISFNLPGHGCEDFDEFNFDNCNAFSKNLYVFLEQSIHQSFHLVGYSLGGLISLNKNQKSRFLKTHTLIATPFQFNQPKFVHLNELRFLYNQSFLNQIKEWDSVIQALPAFGSFRRKAFPVRSKTNYLKEITHIWKKWPLNEIMKSYSSNNPNCPTLIFGSKDHIADPETWSLNVNLKPQLTVSCSTHFDILFRKELSDFLVDFQFL